MFIAVMLASGWPGAVLSGQQDIRPTPLVVLVHGRDQAYQISRVMTGEWLGALEDGLRKIGVDTLVPVEARRFVQYSHVFEYGSVAGPGCPEGETGLPYKRASFSLLLGTAARYLTTGTRNEALGRVRGWANDLLQRPQVLAAQLPDVKEYHDNPSASCETERGLHQVLDSAFAERRPVILLAHSMGALVTLRVLAAHAPDSNANVVHLITFGSQIGAAGMLPWLLGNNWSERGIRMPAITNFVGRDDHLAFRIGARSEARRLADTVADVFIDTRESNQHGFAGYLKHPAMSATIASAWCRGANRRTGVCTMPEALLDRFDSRPPRPYLADLSIALRAFSGAADTSSVLALGVDLRTTLIPLVQLRTNWHFLAREWESGDATSLSGAPRLGSAVLTVPLHVRTNVGSGLSLFVGATPGVGYLYRGAYGFESLRDSRVPVRAMFLSFGMQAFDRLQLGLEHTYWFPGDRAAMGQVRVRAPHGAVIPMLLLESAVRL